MRAAGVEDDDGVDYGVLYLTDDVEREIASLRASYLEWQGIWMFMEREASLVPSQNAGSPPPGENGEAPGNPAQDPLDFTSAPPDEAMARMNARFFVHVTTGTIYCKDDDKLSALGKEKFAVALAGRTVRTTDADGETKQYPISGFWLNSRKRREVSGIQYRPNGIGLKRGHANLWAGWGNVQPRAGNCSVMTDHIYQIIADQNGAKAKFLLDWSADILQNPARKPGVVPVLRGDEGSGKSVYAAVMRRILGSQNVLTTSDPDRITGRFAATANKILVVGEELVFAGNKSQNDKLKHLITGDTIQVEVKFGDPLEIESCHRLMLLSNHEHVLNVGANARRIVMYEVPSTKIGDDKYFDPLQDMAKGRDDATVGAFMRFLPRKL
jgi:hypothetical protein